MPLPALAIPAIISGAASLAGAGISAGTSIAATNARNEAQKRENELAYWRQRQDVARQNAFNSTSAQMARMAAAGLNPNLMYQQAEQGLQSDIPRYEPAQLDSPFEKVGAVGSELVQSLIGLQGMRNQTSLTEAEVALKNMQSFTEVTKQKLNQQTTKNLLQEFGFNVDYYPLRLAMDAASLDKTKAETNKINVDIDFTKKQLDLTDAQIDELAARTGLERVQAERYLYLMASEKDKLLAEIKVLKSQNLLNEANIQLAVANSDYLKKLTWEITQRVYLDYWSTDQRLKLDKYKADIEWGNLRLSEEQFYFGKDMKEQENFREWISTGMDAILDAIKIIQQFMAMVASPAKIGF